MRAAQEKNCIVFHLLVTVCRLTAEMRRLSRPITRRRRRPAPNKAAQSSQPPNEKKKHKMKGLPANNGPSAFGKRIVRISGPVGEKTTQATAGDAHRGPFMKNDDRRQLEQKGVGRTGNCGQTRAQPMEQIKANQRQSRTQRHE